MEKILLVVLSWKDRNFYVFHWNSHKVTGEKISFSGRIGDKEEHSTSHQLWIHSLHTLEEKVVTHTDSSCLDTHADGRSFGVENASAGKVCELFFVFT